MLMPLVQPSQYIGSPLSNDRISVKIHFHKRLEAGIICPDPLEDMIFLDPAMLQLNLFDEVGYMFLMRHEIKLTDPQKFF